MPALFTTNPEDVRTLVDDIQRGRLALPDFQRNFIWESARTARLLASILARYPAGALLTWRAPPGALPPREFAGAPPISTQASPPDRLVLDGQQRLTALYRSLHGVGPDRYFISLKEFINESTMAPKSEDEITWDRTVVTREPNKRERAQLAAGNPPLYETLDWQIDNWLFPLHKIQQPGGFDDWMDTLAVYIDNGEEGFFETSKASLRHVRDTYLRQLRDYDFPVITLTSEATLRAVCQIFETLNTNSVPLGVFQILTAKFYADGVDLRALWRSARNDHPVLRDPIVDHDPDGFGIDPYMVIQALTLRVHRSPQQKTILGRLTALEVQNYWQPTVLSLKRVIEFLRDECGVIHRDLLPYQMLLVPLTGAWMERDGMTGPSQAAALDKIRQYFWSSVLTTNFDQGGASQAEKDYRDLIAWMNGQLVDGIPIVPEAVNQIPISADVLLAARVNKKALLKAIMALTVQAGARDFHNGLRLMPTIYHQDKVDSHHLFPKKRLSDQDPATGIASDGFGSELILNRALIDASTNRRIGAKKPSLYVGEIRTELDADGIFASHLLDVSTLCADDYKSFLLRRLALIVEQIELLTGKSVVPLSDAEPVEDQEGEADED